MITQDLGIATAYGYAKSKGYTGTEAEFAELMASYASTAQTAIEAADRAVEANTAAQSAKTDVQASKTAAQTAAQTATTKASNAVTAADTATTKASEASTSADTASAAATSASTSAQTATTAAATATTKASEAAVSANTATMAKTDAESARDAAAQSASAAAASAESIDPETLEHKAYGAYVVESASGAIASFADGADNIPMKDVLVHIEPVQAGSGDPSPDNVRPITGWTGANVVRTGKNLLPIPTETVRLLSGVVVSASEGKLQITGTGNFHGTYNIDLPYAIPAGTWMALNGNVAGSGVVSYRVRNIESDAYEQIDLNTPKSVSYVVNRIQVAVNPNVEYSYTIENIQLELGSTATDYEPYSGQTYDITFPTEAGTVYGWYVDVTGGELVVDRAMVDMGTLRWEYNTTYAFFASNSLTGRKIGVTNVFSDLFKTKSGSWSGTPYTNALWGNGSYETIYVQYPITKVSEFLSLISGHQLCYELAEPIHYPLTPIEIKTLLGQNNIWADTGNVSVEYRADTTLYITKKITEAVSALS